MIYYLMNVLSVYTTLNASMYMKIEIMEMDRMKELSQIWVRNNPQMYIMVSPPQYILSSYLIFRLVIYQLTVILLGFSSAIGFQITLSIDVVPVFTLHPN